MKSIQSNLVRSLALAFTAIATLSGGALMLWLRHELRAEFDRSLLVRAHAIQSMIAVEPNGKFDIDINLAAMSEFTGANAGEYFRCVDSTGKTIAASSSVPIRTPASGGSWNATLPSGAPARAIQTSFHPPIDREDDKGLDGPATAATALTLIVARDRRPLDAILLHVTLGLILVMFALSVVAIACCLIIVRRGLKSLRDIAGQVAALNPSSPHSRVESSGLPVELSPIVERLNELLDRVCLTLQRERQFNAAVSHELRTPIAELRSAADIALQEPFEPGLARRAAVQAREIALHMQKIVTTLLSIIRSQAAGRPVAVEPIRLRDRIDQVSSRSAGKLSSARLALENGVPPDTTVLANETLLTGIIENLVNNAAEYATPGTSLVMLAQRIDGQVRLEFANEQTGFAAADVGRVFDPFWRGDAARSGSEHIGLGLTLVRAYCTAMGAEVSAALDRNNRFKVSISFPHKEDHE